MSNQDDNVRSSDDATRVVVIRAATPGDASALGRLGALLIRVHHEFDAARFIAPTASTESGYAGFLRSQLAKADAVILVAERDGQVCGYAYGAIEGFDYMALRGPAGVLHDLLVDETQRGHGIGGLLLDAAISALQFKGAPRIVLSTAARNEHAQRLFASKGFRPTMIEMTREHDTI
ncbi:MAG: GNAT family N-acetyltransferase [Gemmatimonadaceae bacterium]